MNGSEGAEIDGGVRAIARLARVFERELGGAEMNLAQFRVLAFLSEGDWAASALAEWLSVSRPSVTSLVDGLVERGWVARSHSEDDRRRVLHQLTARGRRQLAEAATLLDATLSDVLDHLDADDRRAATEGLDLLGEAIGRQRRAVRT